MSTLQVTATVTTEMLLEAAAKLDPDELDELVNKVVKLRSNQVAPSLPHAESELLAKINAGLPEALWQRYQELVALRQAEQLTAETHAELLSLSNQIEQLNAERIQHLVALAALRQQTLPELMQSLGIQPPDYA